LRASAPNEMQFALGEGSRGGHGLTAQLRRTPHFRVERVQCDAACPYL